MIVCNRCGATNADEARLCETCGHKLQSSYSNPSRDDSGRPLEPLETPEPSLDLRRFLVKGLEAWVYLLLLAGAGSYAALTSNWLLLLALVGFTALLAWARKV